MRRTPGAHPPTRAGAVMPVVERRRPRAAAAVAWGEGSPSTWARYSFTTPCEGWLSSVREVAVVGEEEEPLGRHVEAADREDPGLGGHEAGHGRAALGVVGGRDARRRAC